MLGHFGQGLEETVGAGVFDRDTSVVAVGHSPGGHAGIAGGPHIDGRVADVGTMRRADLQRG